MLAMASFARRCLVEDPKFGHVFLTGSRYGQSAFKIDEIVEAEDAAVTLLLPTVRLWTADPLIPACELTVAALPPGHLFRMRT